MNNNEQNKEKTPHTFSFTPTMRIANNQTFDKIVIHINYIDESPTNLPFSFGIGNEE